MKKVLSIVVSLFLVTAFQYTALAQTDVKKEVKEVAEVKKDKKVNVWKTLGKITFRKQYDELMGFKIDVPVFSEDVKNLAGKEITIKGYIIPTEGYKSHKEFVFSAFPYNMCFFCGGAGPETVMEVAAAEPIEFEADAVTIKGILQLNDEDINRLMYSLTDARLVE